jgi:hypothetical protein
MSNTTNDQLEQYAAPTNPAGLATTGSTVPGFGTSEAFDLAQRQAKALCTSSLVPKDYQGMNNMGNCLIALDMAYRIGANPMLVMQNLYVVHGRPGWSSTFLIASVNHCGRYSSLRYEEVGTPGSDDYKVRAWANEKATGERLNGTWITWEMVKAEGWLNKAGSKWKTMPEQMAKYRAAGFWVRTYAPEISMGLLTAEEVQDISPSREVPAGTMTVRLTPKQMQEARFEVEVAGKSSADEVLERMPNLPEDQRAEIATWTYKGE